MKRKLVATILGLAAATAVFNGSSAFAQGLITLDTYLSSPAGPYPLVTYGAGSGGTLGAGVTAASGWHVGLYYSTSALNSVATTSGNMDAAIPGGTLAVGLGATATFSADVAGLFSTSDSFNTGLAAQSLWFVVVAYNGADYASSTVRGHSAAFQLTTSAAPPIPALGGSPGPMGGFSVVAVPEPSTFALAGLGLASLLIFRRRK